MSRERVTPNYRIFTPDRCTTLCIAGMTIGYALDCCLSPTGAILSICTGGAGAYDDLAAHIVTMPAAHAGMLLAVFVDLAPGIIRHRRDVVIDAANALAAMLLVEVAIVAMSGSRLAPGGMMIGMASAMWLIALTRRLVSFVTQGLRCRTRR